MLRQSVSEITLLLVRSHVGNYYYFEVLPYLECLRLKSTEAITTD